MPMTSHSKAGLPGSSRAIFVCSCSDSTVPGMPPSTLTMNENCSGGTKRPMSSRGQTPFVWPVSKHSSSGFTPASFIAWSSLMILP
jgi:hypothetical protein